MAFIDPITGERISVYEQDYLQLKTRNVNADKFLDFMKKFLRNHGGNPNEYMLRCNSVSTQMEVENDETNNCESNPDSMIDALYDSSSFTSSSPDVAEPQSEEASESWEDMCAPYADSTPCTILFRLPGGERDTANIPSEAPVKVSVVSICDLVTCVQIDNDSFNLSLNFHQILLTNSCYFSYS